MIHVKRANVTYSWLVRQYLMMKSDMSVTESINPLISTLTEMTL